MQLTLNSVLKATYYKQFLRNFSRLLFLTFYLASDDLKKCSFIYLKALILNSLIFRFTYQNVSIFELFANQLNFPNIKSWQFSSFYHRDCRKCGRSAPAAVSASPAPVASCRSGCCCRWSSDSCRDSDRRSNSPSASSLSPAELQRRSKRRYRPGNVASTGNIARRRTVAQGVVEGNVVDSDIPRPRPTRSPHAFEHDLKQTRAIEKSRRKSRSHEGNREVARAIEEFRWKGDYEGNSVLIGKSS